MALLVLALLVFALISCMSDKQTTSAPSGTTEGSGTTVSGSETENGDSTTAATTTSAETDDDGNWSKSY